MGALRDMCLWFLRVQLCRASVLATAAGEGNVSTVTVNAGKASMENTALSVSLTQNVQ